MRNSRSSLTKVGELLDNGMYSQALGLLEQLNSKSGSKGLAYLAARVPAESLFRFSADEWITIADADNLEDRLYNLGIQTWSSIDELRGVEILRLAVTEGSEEAPATLGECLYWLQDPLGAEPFLRDAVERRAGAWRRAAGFLGTLISERGLGAELEAIAYLELAQSEDDPIFPIALAEVLVRAGSFEEARNVLIAQVALQNSLAPIALGNLLEDKFGDAELAEVAYRKGIELGDAYSAYNLYLLLDASGRGEEAMEMLHYAADHGDEAAKKHLADLG